MAMGKLQQEHDLKVTKMKEQYIDLTTSLLKDIGQNTKPTSSDLKDATRYVIQKWGGGGGGWRWGVEGGVEVGGGGGEGAACHSYVPTSTRVLSLLTSRPQQSMHGKKGDAPSQGTKGKPPPGLEGAAKRKPSRPAPVVERPSQAQPREPRDGEAG